MAGTCGYIVPGTVMDDILTVFHGFNMSPSRPDNRIPLHDITHVVHLRVHDFYPIFDSEA